MLMDNSSLGENMIKYRWDSPVWENIEPSAQQTWYDCIFHELA